MKSFFAVLETVLLMGGLVISAATCSSVADIPPLYQSSPDTLAIDATVQFLNIEGGCWALTLSSATRLEPLNLPADFRVDGLKVRATITGTKAASVCMIGPVVELLAIQRQ